MHRHWKVAHAWTSAAAGIGALVVAASATSGVASKPTAVSLTVSPGGASCTYSEVTSPRVKCASLKNARINSGTKIKLVARVNGALPAGWKLYIQKEGPFATNSDTKAAGRKNSYPAPHLCGPTRSSLCIATATRKVAVTSFDLFRAVVQKDVGASIEADVAIRWCDKATPGCI
jgi:hypothetical protein